MRTAFYREFWQGVLVEGPLEILAGRTGVIHNDVANLFDAGIGQESFAGNGCAGKFEKVRAAIGTGFRFVWRDGIADRTGLHDLSPQGSMLFILI